MESFTQKSLVSSPEVVTILLLSPPLALTVYPPVGPCGLPRWLLPSEQSLPPWVGPLSSDGQDPSPGQGYW